MTGKHDGRTAWRKQSRLQNKVGGLTQLTYDLLSKSYIIAGADKKQHNPPTHPEEGCWNTDAYSALPGSVPDEGLGGVGGGAVLPTHPSRLAPSPLLKHTLGCKGRMQEGLPPLAARCLTDERAAPAVPAW